MTILCGADPGLSGAIAFLDTVTGDIEVLDMPTLRLTRNGKSKGEIDAAQLANIFWKKHAGHAFVESVGAMPGQGVSSVFAFGRGYGTLIGVLAAVGVPVTFVSAAKWKRALGVPAEKDGARARASQLLPQASDQWPLKKHDGRAEASLLALYGRQSFDAVQFGGIAA